MTFQPCEELFPQWVTARIILSEYVSGIRGWKLVRGPRNSMQITIDSSFPVEAMPPEDRPEVYRRVEEAAASLLPDLSQFLSQPITAMTELHIMSTLGQCEADAVARGEPSLKDRISETLGIKGRWISAVQIQSVVLEH